MNVLTQPSLGSISFNNDAAGSSTISLSASPKLSYDGLGGLTISSTLSSPDKFKVNSSSRLFTVTDAITGTVMDVTNYLGLPILEVFSTATQTIITMGPYGSSAFVLSGNNLGLGTATPSQRLTVMGNISATGTTLVDSDVEITSSIKGIILKSPNNTRWRVEMTDSGALSSTQI